MENINITTSNIFGTVEVLSSGVLTNIEEPITFKIRDITIHVSFRQDESHDGLGNIPIEDKNAKVIDFVILNSRNAPAGAILHPYNLAVLDNRDLLISLAIFYDSLYEASTIQYTFYLVV
jgi:hypothetical protein